MQECIGQRTLADAGLAGHEHHLTSARLHLREAAFELRKLASAADKMLKLGPGRQLRDAAAALADLGCPHHQAVAAPVTGLDVSRTAGVIAERAAQLLNAGGQCIVADRQAAPDLLEQLLLADDVLRPCGQQSEHGGGARRQLRFGITALKLAGPRVETERAERKLAVDSPCQADPTSRKFPGTRPGLRRLSFSICCMRSQALQSSWASSRETVPLAWATFVAAELRRRL